MTEIEAAFCGALTKDADHRTSKTGKPFTLLNVLVGDGDGRQFVSTIVFGDGAVNVAALEKGRRVYIEGKIEIAEWIDRDGNKKSGLKSVSFHAMEASKIGRRREQKPAAKERPNGTETAPIISNFHHDPIGF